MAALLALLAVSGAASAPKSSVLLPLASCRRCRWSPPLGLVAAAGARAAAGRWSLSLVAGRWSPPLELVAAAGAGRCRRSTRCRWSLVAVAGARAAAVVVAGGALAVVT